MINNEDAYKAGGWIRTQNGTFYPFTPRFDLRDISHSLSMLCRFNGHCTRFFSVAEHSVMVSVLMEKMGVGDPLEGLLHDATEAYLSDVPAPFKQYLPDWKAWDARTEKAFREQFAMPSEKTVGCKEADWLALFIEAFQNMPGQGDEFTDPMNLRPKALMLRDVVPLRYLSPTAARIDFEDRYYVLTGKRIRE